MHRHLKKLKTHMSKFKRQRIRKMTKMTLPKNTNNWKVEKTMKMMKITNKWRKSNQVLPKLLPHHAFQKVSHNKKVKSSKLSILAKSLLCQQPMQLQLKEQKSKRLAK